MNIRTETLGALLARYAGGNDVPRVRFADALRRGDDPLHILPCLAHVGVTVRTLEDLLAAGTDEGEEELNAFRVEEGVAVVLATDGQWLLFESGEAAP